MSKKINLEIYYLCNLYATALGLDASRPIVGRMMKGRLSSLNISTHVALFVCSIVRHHRPLASLLLPDKDEVI